MLLNIIEEDMQANQEEMKDKIPGFIQDYKNRHDELTSSNKDLER